MNGDDNTDKLKYYTDLKIRCQIFTPKKIVFGEGNLDADIMCIGEAPGGTEIKLNHCFVGPAGKNLDEFLNYTGINRNKLYLTNAVKFRPIERNRWGNITNRTPDADEIQRFLFYLEKEIDIVQPKLIITLGGIALKATYGDYLKSIKAVHGEMGDIRNGRIQVFHLFHPASVIYNEDLTTEYYKDLDKLKIFLKFSNLSY